jgi:hypothetical protein
VGVVPDREQAAGSRRDSGGNGHIPPRIAAALIQLAEARRYAAGRSVWDFAVEIGSLCLNANDLRWLIYKGLVEHAWEITPAGRGARQTVSPTRGEPGANPVGVSGGGLASLDQRPVASGSRSGPRTPPESCAS